MENEKVYTLNKTYKKYFSEVWVDIKKLFKVEDFSIILFLGGKNRGKSFSAFEMFYKEIKKGNKVVYMRNSKQEIDNIKNVIAGEVEKLLGVPVSIKNEGIFNKLTKEIIVLFVSSKSYNNLSGNTLSYSLVFYDEYNQNLTTDMMVLVENFLLSMNTLFRTNKFKIVVCGNTKTQNNIFFNLYHINPPLEDGKITVFNWDNYLLCVRYDDDVFSEFVGSTRDMEKIKEANPELYDQMFLGKSYGFEDELIINKVFLQYWTPTNDYIIFDERIYRKFIKVIEGEEFWGLFFVGNLTNTFNFDNKNIYTNNLKLKYLYGVKNIEGSESEGFLIQILKQLGLKKLFFSDFILYNYIVDNKWIFIDKTWRSLY